jgi:cytochrome bd-type quinol oxidase subunit 2
VYLVSIIVVPEPRDKHKWDYDRAALLVLVSVVHGGGFGAMIKRKNGREAQRAAFFSLLFEIALSLTAVSGMPPFMPPFLHMPIEYSHYH